MSASDQELLAIACAAADAGAAELSRYWGNLSQVRSKGRAGDLVTEADLAAEAAVLQLLPTWRIRVAILHIIVSVNIFCFMQYVFTFRNANSWGTLSNYRKDNMTVLDQCA